MSKPKDTTEVTTEVKPQVNPYTTINNLYTLYGKKCVEVEALQNTVRLLNQKIRELKADLKELKELTNGNAGLN